MTFAARDLLKAPSLISLARIPLAAAFPLALGSPPLALAVLAAAGASDLVDGWYARHFHEETETGATLDGATDKIFAFGALASLIARGMLDPVSALLLCARDIGELPLAIRVVLGRTKKVVGRRANALGKVATLFQYATLAVAAANGPHVKELAIAAGVIGAAAAISYWARPLDA